MLNQSIVVGGSQAQTINQTFVYDALNRLRLAVENPTGTPNAQNPVCAGITGASS